MISVRWVAVDEPKRTPRAYYAATYDVPVGDWPGEIDFYLAAARAAGPAEVLELAVGTGRIAARLAQAGWKVTGLDRSPEMLAVARAKTAEQPNLRLIEGDMRSYDLGRTFGLAIIPGHSFQNLLTADDELACLRTTLRHLAPDGRLIIHLDHQDTGWLGSISPGGRLAGVFEPAFGLVLRPEIAALSMSGSSFLVAVNALLLKRLLPAVPEAPAPRAATAPEPEPVSR